MVGGDGMRRYAAKRDISENAQVKALRKAGCLVWLKLPCDALVWIPRWRVWQPMEFKTPTKSGRRRKRNDQPEQDELLSLTDIPVTLTAEQALEAAGLGISRTLKPRPLYNQVQP